MRSVPTYVLVLALVVLAGCASSARDTSAPAAAAHASTAAPVAPAAPAAPAAPKVHKLASGLVYEDLVVGDGKMADPGLVVTVHYTGWLTNGTKFDSSLDRGQPYKFQLGAGQVIAGWDQGVRGMRVGGKRKLTIPSDMGYGPNGMGPIPPNATLLFDVQLLGVE